MCEHINWTAYPEDKIGFATCDDCGKILPFPVLVRLELKRQRLLLEELACSLMRFNSKEEAMEWRRRHHIGEYKHG